MEWQRERALKKKRHEVGVRCKVTGSFGERQDWSGRSTVDMERVRDEAGDVERGGQKLS